MDQTNTQKFSRDLKFLIVIIAAFFALVVAAMITFFYGNSENVSRHNKEYLIDNTRQVADYLDASLNEGYNNVRILGELLDRSISGPNVDVADLRHLLDNSVFDFIEFADKDGLDHNITSGVSDATDRQYYLEAMQNRSGMELIYNSRATHETLLMYYTPVHFKGEPIGSLVGVYQAAGRLTKQMEVEYYGAKATSYLCTPEGRIIACTAGYDPAEERFASAIAGDDQALAKSIESAISDGSTLTFAINDNKAGGCLMKLKGSGWYLIQVFPTGANKAIITSGNALGAQLVLVLVLLFAALTTYIIHFSRKKEREITVQQEKIRSAQEANKMKSNFVQNMSHDIRTPLNAIVGYSQLLGMPEVYLSDGERAEFSEYINSSADMLTMLLDDVLNISDIEHGILKINKTKVSCNEICRKAVNCASMRVPVGVKLYYTSEVDANYTVLTDAKRVQQILVNFLTNSCKHTMEGEIHVHCSLSEKPGSVTFSATDTGDGVPEDKAEEIFKRFTTLDSETGGHGMGLSICCNLADMLGGTVALDRSYTNGARFILVIPITE